MSRQSNTSTRPLPAAPPTWFTVAALAISIIIVYWRALDAPLIFDDTVSISSNTSIRSLWPLIGTAEHRGPLNPVRDLPTSARPLANYSFALNYHFGGLNVFGYHAANLLLHFLTAALLMAVVQRTLRLPYFEGRFDSSAGWLAFIAALLWAIHPLLTDAVAYITQRTELLMAWFFFATLYCAMRYWALLPLPPGEGRGEGALPQVESHHLRQSPSLWLTLAILACLCGMLSKEAMVSAPIIVLLFERTFISGTFAKSLRQSWPLYVGLAGTWIPLLLLSAAAPRSESAGFHLCENVLVYWFTQCKVLLIYLKLAIWPWPLLCAYEPEKVDTVFEFCVFVIPVLLMSALAIVLLWRNHPLGFMFVSIGVMLAPTSIVPILTEPAAERRMYLPLAALIVLAVVGTYLFLKRQQSLSNPADQSSPATKSPYTAATVAVVLIAVVYGAVSIRRLSDYYNETLMWQQVTESQPLNHMAHYNLGLLYNYAGRESDSLAELQTAVAVHGGFPSSRSALGFALINAGRMPEALAQIETALKINPEYIGALNNMGIALTKLCRSPEAIQYLEHAVRVDPSHADAHTNLGKALMSVGRTAEAKEQLQIAASLTPDDPDILLSQAESHANNNELPQAIELFKRALEIRPDFAGAHNGLGIALHRSGDVRGAFEHFQRFQQLRPNEPGAYFNLGIIAAGENDFQKAASLYQKAATLSPDSPQAHFFLADALTHIGQQSSAMEHFQKTLELNPNMLAAYVPLADALVSANRNAEAKSVAERGVAAATANGDEAMANQLKSWLSQQSK